MEKPAWITCKIVFGALLLLIFATVCRDWNLTAHSATIITTNDTAIFYARDFANAVKLDGYLVSTNASFYIQAAKEFGVLTNLVNELVASGEVCRVRGHQWEDGCGMIGCLVMHPSPSRHCAVCRTLQSREIGPWR